MVALRDFTEAEVVRFAEFARSEPYVIRFIEFMPLDADRTWSRDRVLPNEEVRAMIDAVYPLEPVGRERHGTSRRWRFADGKGEIGFISPVTEPFCGDCNRIRLTAEGELRTCLFSMTETDLREPLRTGATDAEIETIIRDAVWRKELKHHVNDEGFVQPERTMSQHRRMKTIEEALAAILDGITPLEVERVPLAEAADRTAAEDAAAAVDLPPFDRSAMDGYAVRSADTAPNVAAAPRGRRGRRRGRDRTSWRPGPRRRSPPAPRSRPARTRSCSPSWPRLSDGHVAPAARSSRAATCACAARTSTPATCWCAPGSG